MDKTGQTETTLCTMEAVKTLIAQDAITGVLIRQFGGNWIVIFMGGKSPYIVKTARGMHKTHKTLEAAAWLVKQAGYGSAVLDIDSWEKGQGGLL